ncbi:MAG: heme A synthase [Actinobacteria bacterium]|nr:heme A synthase [Actinomycetota bacterium]
MRRLSPSTFALLTTGVTWAVAVIIVTGGAVRLTGSGLGCPDWPTCTQDRLVAAWDYHQMVEFVNRMVTGIVSVAVILAVLGAWIRRPRRRDLVLLACGLVAGVIGQIVLGGITVLFDLAPQLVMAHFLLSLVLLSTALVLRDRAGAPPTPPVVAVADDVVRLSRVMLFAASVVVVTGTIVTGSGPHGGDTRAQRFPFLPTETARVHGIAVTVFLALTVFAVAALRRSGARPQALRRATVLLAAIVAQAAVGYTQYFTGVPAALVAVHLAGAVAVWTAVVRFHLGLFHRPGAPETIERWREPLRSNSNVPTSAVPPTTTSAPTAPGS